MSLDFSHSQLHSNLDKMASMLFIQVMNFESKSNSNVFYPICGYEWISSTSSISPTKSSDTLVWIIGCDVTSRIPMDSVTTLPVDPLVYITWILQQPIRIQVRMDYLEDTTLDRSTYFHACTWTLPPCSKGRGIVLQVRAM